MKMKKMSKTKILGYIVEDNHGTLELAADIHTPKTGVLWRGNVATVFQSRKAADRAIKRTITYANLHGYKWGTWYDIKRLKARSV